MPTDDERRAVARRLRDMRLDPWDDAACEIAQCAGIACCNSECHGSDETPECTMALADRLADLIEPDHVGDSNKVVGRDALLALAEELEEETGSVCGVCMGKTARRIREALGVTDG